MNIVDEYLKNASSAQRAELERIRKVIKQVVPKATESISYGVPAFKIDGHTFTYFAFFRNHMSLYPSVSESLKKKLVGYEQAKGTIRFTLEKPIPTPLLKEIIKDHLKRAVAAYKK